MTFPIVTAMQRTLVSILLDQFLASPVIIALWEIPVPALLSTTLGKDKDKGATVVVQEISHDIQTKLPQLLLENAKIWTLANAIIYNLPLQYRVLASSCTDVIWQSILSQYNNHGCVGVLEEQEDVDASTVFATMNRELEEMMVGEFEMLLEDDTATIPMVELSSTAMGSTQQQDTGFS